MLRFFFIVFLIVFFLLGFKYIKEPVAYRFPALTYFPPMPLSPTNAVTNEGVDLGRYLFYDPALSDKGTISCSSCHKQASAFSDSPNAFSFVKEGRLMKRNTLPLFNLAWYSSFFWDGRAPTLEDQVFHPIRSTVEMNQTWSAIIKKIKAKKFYVEKFKKAFGNKAIDSVLVARAIAQFERTLISHSSKFDRVIERRDKLNNDELEGYELMNDMTKGNCLHCHTTDANVLGTTGLFSNIGLDSVGKAKDYTDKGLGGTTGILADYGKFKIPSLRNLIFTPPYMHDGRFKTLEEVLDFYNNGAKETINLDFKMDLVHQGGLKLTVSEKKKIIAFLYSLSDSVFVNNPEFSNPFKK